MSEPKRFFDSCDDFERRLLRSVRKDAPAIGAASKTMVALGLNPAGVAATAAAGVAARAFGARAGSALTVLKGLGVGLLVGTVAIGVSGGLWQSSVRNARPVPDLLGGRRPSIVTGEPARPMSAEQPPAGSAITRPIAIGDMPKPSLGGQRPAARDAAPVAETSTPPSDPQAPPVTSSTAAFGPSASASRVAETPSAVSIAEQIELIDRARSALKRGRAREALDFAGAYAQRWPNGELTIEAAIVRIEAELAQHDRSAAERDARAIIAALPGSRYVVRVRALFSPPLAE